MLSDAKRIRHDRPKRHPTEVPLDNGRITSSARLATLFWKACHESAQAEPEAYGHYAVSSMFVGVMDRRAPSDIRAEYPGAEALPVERPVAVKHKVAKTREQKLRDEEEEQKADQKGFRVNRKPEITAARKADIREALIAKAVDEAEAEAIAIKADPARTAAMREAARVKAATAPLREFIAQPVFDNGSFMPAWYSLPGDRMPPSDFDAQEHKDREREKYRFDFTPKDAIEVAKFTGDFGIAECPMAPPPVKAAHAPMPSAADIAYLRYLELHGDKVATDTLNIIARKPRHAHIALCSHPSVLTYEVRDRSSAAALLAAGACVTPSDAAMWDRIDRLNRYAKARELFEAGFNAIAKAHKRNGEDEPRQLLEYLYEHWTPAKLAKQRRERGERDRDQETISDRLAKSMMALPPVTEEDLRRAYVVHDDIVDDVQELCGRVSMKSAHIRDYENFE